MNLHKDRWVIPILTLASISVDFPSKLLASSHRPDNCELVRKSCPWRVRRGSLRSKPILWVDCQILLRWVGSPFRSWWMCCGMRHFLRCRYHWYWVKDDAFGVLWRPKRKDLSCVRPNWPKNHTVLLVFGGRGSPFPSFSKNLSFIATILHKWDRLERSTGLCLLYPYEHFRDFSQCFSGRPVRGTHS